MKIAVIGAGPGGVAAAVSAAKKGYEVTVIEKNGLGGTCLQRGCIPTKALIAVSKIFEKQKKKEDFGSSKLDLSLDLNLVVDRNKKIIGAQVKGIELTFKNMNINLIKGEAVLDKDGLSVIKEGGSKEKVIADKIILAAGSKAAKPSFFDFNNDNIITSDEALNLNKVPESLLIIGGGAIGLEFASVFNSFASKVTVIEMMEQLLPGMDTELASSLARELKKKDIKIMTGTKVESLEYKEGKIEVKASSGEFNVDKVLVAVGRIPDTSFISKDAGIKKEGKGFIITDKNFKTSSDNVYAIGDLIGNPMLAHKASFEGHEVIKSISGENCFIDYNAVPGCVYTIPEAASVGLSEENAKKSGIDYEVKKFFTRALGIAWAAGEIEGFTKILINKGNNEIIGMHILGATATELISLGAVAVRNKLKASDISESVFPHPTFSEGIYEALIN
ncbi:MAG: dihydrolipoyl dehydrogenase [Armatimonadota bacterium]